MRSMRSFALATAVVFGVSTMFPIVAALASEADRFPRLWAWWM